MIILDFLKYLKQRADLCCYHCGLLRPRDPMLAVGDLINQNSLGDMLVFVIKIAAIKPLLPYLAVTFLFFF